MRLFDTDFLVDLVNSEPGAARLAREIDEAGLPSFMSVVSVHEYLFGVRFRNRREKGVLKDKLESAERDLSRFEEVPLTPEIARLSSGIQAELASLGKPIGINDVYIAATAIRYNFTLVTRNKSHFRRIQKLSLESY